MFVSMPCFCSSSQARMPSQVDAICTASKPFVGPHASIGNPYLRSVSGLSRASQLPIGALMASRRYSECLRKQVSL